VLVESVAGRKSMAEKDETYYTHHHALDDARPNHGDQMEEAVYPKRPLAREDGFAHVAHTHEENVEGELRWVVQAR